MVINTKEWNEKMNSNYHPGETIADIILTQLGGNRFLIMTGAKDLISTDNSLQMSLPRNASKANRLEITYSKGMDLYTMRFYRYTPMRWNSKKVAFNPEKITEVATFEEVYGDQLQEIFTEVTGLYTRL